MVGYFDLNGPATGQFNFGNNGYIAPVAPTIGAAGMQAAAANVVSGGAGSGSVVGGAGVDGVSGVGINLGNSTPLGPNIGTAGLVLGGIQAIGNIWNAWQQNKLAKEQFAYTKDVTETNLANQIETYNTSLGDRVRTQVYAESGQAGGMTRDQGRRYLEENKLSRQHGQPV